MTRHRLLTFKTCIRLLVSVFLFFILFSIFFTKLKVYSQSDFPIDLKSTQTASSSSSVSSREVGGIGYQTTQLQNNHSTIRELEERLKELNQKILTHEKELVDLQVNEAETRAKLSLLIEKSGKAKNQLTTKEAEILKIDTDIKKVTTGLEKNTLEEQKKEVEGSILRIKEEQNSLSQEIEEINKNLSLIEAEIQTKKSQLEGVRAEITQVNSLISLKKEEVSKQVGSLWNTILREVKNWSTYLFLLFIYWFCYKVLIWQINKRFSNTSVGKLSKIILTISYVVLTFLTLAIISIQRLELLRQVWAILALVSWGIAWALKDFFASFLAYILIISSKEYQVGEIIQIGNILGKVTKIGAYSTEMKQISLDKETLEQFTAQIVSVPNNYTLTHPVINISKSRKMIWHTLRVVYEKVQQPQQIKLDLENLIKKEFKWFSKNYLEFLDRAKNTDEYEPKVSYSPDSRGMAFNITFASKFGTYQKAVDRIMEALLIYFSEQKTGFKFVEKVD